MFRPFSRLNRSPFVPPADDGHFPLIERTRGARLLHQPVNSVFRHGS